MKLVALVPRRKQIKRPVFSSSLPFVHLKVFLEFEKRPKEWSNLSLYFCSSTQTLHHFPVELMLVPWTMKTKIQEWSWKVWHGYFGSWRALDHEERRSKKGYLTKTFCFEKLFSNCCWGNFRSKTLCLNHRSSSQRAAIVIVFCYTVCLFTFRRFDLQM